MKFVLDEWNKIMKECDLTVGPTDENIINELEKSLGIGNKLASWYREYAPRMGELDFGGNPIQMYEPEELIDFQMNFSYDLQNMQENRDWKGDWIVIADKGLDPFIFDKKTKKIYHACHGQGEITLRVIAPDLEGFIKVLVILCEICYVKYNGQFLNDELEFDEKILQEIKKKLSTILPHECVKNWMSVLE